MIYKITAGDFIYIGYTSRELKNRIYEHNYRLGDPVAHIKFSRSRLYTKLRELQVSKISDENCVFLCEGNKLEEQREMDKIPFENRLNSIRSCITNPV